ncbi:hypothetical protein SAMN04488527_12818 [Aliiroseovarius crassostreae]|uniref:Uncharacterized protein n=1 Tax=Aliiroseovarius crassostreae TaxID=154981 RepID=A0A0P7KHA3_9RHOB|nr:hypothetical protein [Aliiroseovarius crassostreae]KPN62742.1 hypothetical protein AKJ29_00785 [Aliiroseovarius crassostreae]SFU88622.1 hypothetical protein SAMN04488527_12818 [Aliiroseovarius crassostreae]
MFKRLVSSALIFGAASLAPPIPAAHAMPSCAPRPDLVEKLSGQYREGLVGGGLQNHKELLEVWSSPETGSFTILVTHANGVSCIVAAGRNWHGGTPEKAKVPDLEG